MAPFRLPLFALLTVAVGGCDVFSEVDPPVSPVERAPATYVVTLDATWSAATHPDAFPPNPHFSRLTGAAHAETVAVWAPGALASDGLKDVAEIGRTVQLQAEVDVLGGAAAYVEGGPVGVSPGAATVTVTVTEGRPLVSVVSMLAPSPDWFVGVAGLDLRTDDGWADRVTVDLAVYDAGTDDGASYTAADAPRASRAPVAETAYAPVAGTPVGTLTFERQGAVE